MDIDTLRKIQETEKTLRIHNISVSPNEAVRSVNGDLYVGGTRVPSFEEVNTLPGEKLLKAKEEAYQKSLSKQSTNKEVDEMDERFLKEIKGSVDEHGELINQQAQLIYQLQGAVNELIKEIKKIQSSVPTKNPAERQVVLKPEDKTEHPRSGGYTSADVSIDKFFNFSGSR